MLNRRAGLSLELMFSFFVVGICSMLALQSFHLFGSHNEPSKEMINLGIMQLQELVALSEIVGVNDEQVTLLYQNSVVTLIEKNESLMRAPGTVIYLHPVKEVNFWMDEELLFISFFWHKKEYRYVLGKKEWWRD